MHHRLGRIGLIAGLAIAITAGIAVRPHAEPAGALTPGQRSEVETVVRDYLAKHPEAVLDALRQLQERQQSQQQTQERSLLKTHRKALEDDGASFAAGPSNARVTVVEFFDYRCGYCKRSMPDVMKLISDKPDVRVVLKELPVLGPESATASRAALAALRQDRGKYLAFHRALLAERGTLNEARVFAIAGEVGYDVAKLRAAMDDPAIARQIEANRELAARLNIEGTPSFVIGDAIVPGAVEYSSLTALIDEAATSCTTC